MRVFLILAALLPLYTVAQAASDPDRFCRQISGYQPGSTEYGQCQRMLEALDGAVMQGPSKPSLEKTYKGTPPLDVATAPAEVGDSFSKLIFTSRADNVTIRDIRINRGNCEPHIRPRFPQILQFGERFSIGYFSLAFTQQPGKCVPIELDAYTDRGDYRLSLHQAVADDGLEVSFGPDPVVPGWDAAKALLFTSHEDNITILTIRINRGNC